MRGGSRQVIYSTAADRIAFSLKLPCVSGCTCVSHHCSVCHYYILASLDLAEASNKEFTTRGWPNSQRGVYWAVHPCTGLSRRRRSLSNHVPCPQSVPAKVLLRQCTVQDTDQTTRQRLAGIRESRSPWHDCYSTMCVQEWMDHKVRPLSSSFGKRKTKPAQPPHRRRRGPRRWRCQRWPPTRGRTF